MCKIILKSKQQKMLVSFSFPPFLSRNKRAESSSHLRFIPLDIATLHSTIHLGTVTSKNQDSSSGPSRRLLVAGGWGSGNTKHHTRQQVALSTSSRSGAFNFTQLRFFYVVGWKQGLEVAVAYVRKFQPGEGRSFRLASWVWNEKKLKLKPRVLELEIPGCTWAVH